ncbi:hypothetical protein [Lapillicoccus jejuensis]|uniref:DUF1795 domain-containing protein n=1 Tax=Lapillicoccus jejuensis TaxID=402171 RepID=A0A542DZ50_9MICO|nr:hypothetical protein [Lapillicoccus jejuensis]TQJ08370.1 hypothetical protein FB458_1458 [Lapillicoccus jejuensis]
MPTPVSFPSDLFPGPPSVHVVLPDGWAPVVVPGTVLAAGRLPGEDEPAGPVPTVEVRVETGEPGLDVAAPLAELRGSVAQRPGGVASDPFRASLGDLELVGTDLSWVEDGLGTVLQVHLLHVLPALVPGGPTRLVRLTGTCGGPRVREEYDALREVLSTATVTPWAAS